MDLCYTVRLANNRKYVQLKIPSTKVAINANNVQCVPVVLKAKHSNFR